MYELLTYGFWGMALLVLLPLTILSNITYNIINIKHRFSFFKMFYVMAVINFIYSFILALTRIPVEGFGSAYFYIFIWLFIYSAITQIIISLCYFISVIRSEKIIYYIFTSLLSICIPIITIYAAFNIGINVLHITPD